MKGSSDCYSLLFIPNKGLHECRKRLFVKTDDTLISFTGNRAAKQIGFSQDELNQFLSVGKGFVKPPLFVNRVAGVQERRNRIVSEDRFDFFLSQRFFCVIAFQQNFGGFFAQQMAQETPGVAASGSGAFVKEMNARCGHGGAPSIRLALITNQIQLRIGAGLEFLRRVFSAQVVTDGQCFFF